MLDIYVIQDGEDDWAEPDEEKYVDSISMDEHAILIETLVKSDIADFPKYTEDSRVKSQKVVEIFAELVKYCSKMSVDDERFENVVHLKRVFEYISKMNRYGVMCFCD